FDAATHSINQLVLCFSGGPLALWFQSNVDFIVADAFRIAAQLSAADLRDYSLDFRKLSQGFLDLARNFNGPGKGDTGRHRGPNEHVAFIDGRQKLAAQNVDIRDTPDD